MKGYEDFNELTEVLEMLKGGFGLIGAPNLFTNKVDEIFIANGARPTCSEPKVYVKTSPHHRSSNRVGGAYGTSRTVMGLMVSAHMDDFKSIGRQEELNWLRGILSTAFGGDVKMLQDNSFIHTGIRRTNFQENDKSTSHYTLDQNEYASAIHPVTLPELMKMKTMTNYKGYCKLVS
mgnify:CR=1 FL=1